MLTTNGPTYLNDFFAIVKQYLPLLTLRWIRLLFNFQVENAAFAVERIRNLNTDLRNLRKIIRKFVT